MNTKHTLAESFSFAINGIKLAYKFNRNIWIHTVAGIVASILGIVLGLEPSELSLIAVMILLVISTEMINTVVEEVVDLVTKDYREEAKIAKDVSAGMVLLTSIGSVVVGILIFVPHIVGILQGN